MLVIKRIRVHYRLRAGDADREAIERVHGFHHQKCPVYRSLEKAIDITTKLDIVGEEGG